MNQIKIFCPATVANLSCGFDVLGLCLEGIGDEMIIRKSDQKGLRITKITGADLPLETEKNVAGVAGMALLNHLDLEFGFGEDTEYGLQIRNYGVDVFYVPYPEILHLKAPIGGFRFKYIHPWENESIQPKPSPTIMYVKEKYSTKEQMFGYKLRLFLKTYQYKFWKVKVERIIKDCCFTNKLSLLLPINCRFLK